MFDTKMFDILTNGSGKPLDEQTIKDLIVQCNGIVGEKWSTPSAQSFITVVDQNGNIVEAITV